MARGRYLPAQGRCFNNHNNRGTFGIRSAMALLGDQPENPTEPHEEAGGGAIPAAAHDPRDGAQSPRRRAIPAADPRAPNGASDGRSHIDAHRPTQARARGPRCVAAAAARRRRRPDGSGATAAARQWRRNGGGATAAAAVARSSRLATAVAGPSGDACTLCVTRARARGPRCVAAAASRRRRRDDGGVAAARRRRGDSGGSGGAAAAPVAAARSSRLATAAAATVARLYSKVSQFSLLANKFLEK